MKIQNHRKQRAFQAFAVLSAAIVLPTCTSGDDVTGIENGLFAASPSILPATALHDEARMTGTPLTLADEGIHYEIAESLRPEHGLLSQLPESRNPGSDEAITFAAPTVLGRFSTYTAKEDRVQYDIARGTFSQTGGGLELRLSGQKRLFIDAIRTLRDEEKFSDMIRIGVRYEF